MSVPSAFQSARVLRALNTVAVGASLAALVAVIFAGAFDMPSLFAGISTAVVGVVWASLLRMPATIGRSRMRVGWVASLPLAIANSAVAASLTFSFTPQSNPSLESLLGGALAGATIGAIFWVPSLVLTLLLFGVPIAWSQKLAKQGLAGEERGEGLVALVTVALAAVALLLAYDFWPHVRATERFSGIVFGSAAAIVACVSGVAAFIVAQVREARRREFVARAEAGEVRGFRVDAHDEGKVLVRVTSQGQGYRVADYEEEVFLLDEEGRATEARAAERAR